MTKLTKIPKLEVIVWDDVTSHKGGEWTDDPVSEGLSRFYTVGWVTFENEEYLTIYGSISADGTTFGHDTCIPKGIIRDRKELKAKQDAD